MGPDQGPPGPPGPSGPPGPPGEPTYDVNAALAAALEHERLAYADYQQVQQQNESFDYSAEHPFAVDDARDRWEAAQALVEQLRSKL